VHAGGLEAQCYNQAEHGARPTVYAPFQELTAWQQQEFSALLQGLFNASAPRPPVRPPVLHWDERVVSTPHGPKVKLQLRAASTQQAAKLWAQGRGEPRQDSWQVIDSLAGNQLDRQDELVRALQAQKIERYVSMQIDQLLNHIEEWSQMMDRQQLRCAALRCSCSSFAALARALFSGSCYHDSAGSPAD
jgi:hypothetical protein